MEDKQRIRRFSFNMHHNIEKGITLEKFISDFSNGWNCDYIIVGQEKTEENNIDHIQGYIEFTNATTWEQCRQRFISLYGYVSEIKKSIADAESNFKYCSKSGNFLEYGSRTIRLKMEDVAINVVSLLRSGMDLLSIMVDNKSYTQWIIKNYKNLQAIEKEIRYERKGISIENKDLPF